MQQVFILHHIHKLPASGVDVKVIGVYATKKDADEAIVRLTAQPGFREFPKEFTVDQYKIGEDHWTEGFIPITELVVG